MENKEESGKVAKIGRALWDKYSQAVELMGITPKKIPAENINQQLVAKTMLDHILVEKAHLGDKTKDLISPATILSNMGYFILFDSGAGNLRKKYPNEYRALRRSLDILVQNGVLIRVSLPQPDIYGEDVYYQIVDKNALKEASSIQIGLPASP